MKKRFLIVFICCFTISVLGVNAQKSELLSASDSKRIASSDKKINKGNLIAEKKEKYTSQIEELENGDGRIRIGKIERLKTKANKEVIKSASYYKDGYSKKYKTYRKVVNQGLKNKTLNPDVSKMKDYAATAYKNGRKWRRKSSGLSDVNKAVEYLYKANGVEEDAIKTLVKIIESGNVVEEKESLVIEQTKDSVIEVPDTSSVIEPPILLLPKDTLPSVNDSTSISVTVDSTSMSPKLDEVTPLIEDQAVVIEPEKSNELLLYFSVQVLAEKQPVPKEKVITLYNGPLEVVKHEADGWYRYSIGKFENLEDAKDMIAKTGIKGYVVAYHNEERISTRQAVELMTAE